MTKRTPIALLALLALVAAAAGCADFSLEKGTEDDYMGPYPGSGGIVFVGTDSDFVSNVYLVDLSKDPSDDNYLINLTPRAGSGETNNGDYTPGTLLAASAPYGMPNLLGSRVAFVTIPDAPMEGGMGRVSLAEEYEMLLTSPSIEGLQRATFDPSGTFLILTIVDNETGDVTLEVMDASMNKLSVVNADLGPVAVSGLQYEGQGRQEDSILISGVRNDPGLAAVWEVPLPFGDVELLTADLEQDALEPVVSPDGRFMAVELYNNVDTRTDIAILDFASSSWSVITEDITFNGDHRSPVWEPSADDGNRLAFLRYDPDPEVDRTLLYVASEIDGWALTMHDLEDKLAGERRLANPRWHPGGGQLLMDYRQTDNASGLNLTELVLYDVDQELSLINPWRLDTDGEPELAHWSYDGQQVLLWDRSVTTNDLSAERTPIRIYEIGSGQTSNISIESSSSDNEILFLDYPLFLHRNTLWY